MLALAIQPKSNNDSILNHIHKVDVNPANIIELRCENISLKIIKKFIKSSRLPVILTCHKKSKQSVDFYKKIDELNPGFIDIDYKSFPKFSKSLKSKLIASAHLKSSRMDVLKNVGNKLINLRPYAIKLVFQGNTVYDLLKIKALYPELKFKNKIIFATHPLSSNTRILSPAWGGFMNYSSFDETKKTASGQVPISFYKKFKNVNKINKHTKIFAIVGSPIAHSKSPEYFNSYFSKYKMNGLYVAFDCNSPQKTVALIENLNISGLSVTMPLKEKLIKSLNPIMHTPPLLSAINTLIKKNNKWQAYNTDFMAIKLLFNKYKKKMKNKSILLIGAGGMAKAFASALKEIGLEVIVTNRTKSKGKAFAKLFDLIWINKNDLKNHKFDVVINATPIGMNPNKQLPVPNNVIKSSSLCVDSVYNPIITPFIKKAQEFNINCIKGNVIFNLQAKEQLKLFKNIF